MSEENDVEFSPTAEAISLDVFEQAAVQSHNMQYLAEAYRLSYEEVEMYEEAAKKARQKKEALAEALCDVLIAEGVSKITVTGVGTLSPVKEPSCSILPGKEDKVFLLLEGAGHGAIIKRAVAWQSLNKLYREGELEGVVNPEDFRLWERKRVRMLRAKEMK